MGGIFGKVSKHEPDYTVLLEVQGPTHGANYELRRYRERFAVETRFKPRQKEASPFMLLAGYVGLYGNPQNESKEAICMPDPGAKHGKRAAIARMAPLVINNDRSTGETTLEFILPARYDDITKIPRPTNPNVRIQSISPAVGAVHCFRGPFSVHSAQHWANRLADQLLADGLVDVTKDYVMSKYQLWGYNPPNSISIFRRNEVWIELTHDQANHLISNYGGSIENLPFK